LIVTLFAAAGLMASGCAGGRAQSAATATSTTVNASLLPGESVNDGLQRLTDACMDAWHEPFTMTAGITDGKPEENRVYSANPVSQQRQRDCVSKALDKIGIRPLSSAQLEQNYHYQVALVACLQGRGYDMGAPVSLEAFIAADGVIDASTKFSEFGGADQPRAAQDYSACATQAGKGSAP
jgi:hypothetical protein